MNKPVYHILDNSVVITYQGRPETISGSDRRYDTILKLIAESKYDETAFDRIIQLLGKGETVFEESGLKLKDGKLFDGDSLLPDSLTHRIVKLRDMGMPLEPLLNFWNNLKQNPSFNSRAMLYKFLEHNGHPLTEDGCFIAYRGLREDFKDKHTGNFDNSPGQVLEMPRTEVDDNPKNTCSNGFHVACYDYAKGFGEKLVEVKVNPIDVVAVPEDYNGTKMRVCKFEVVQECIQMRKEEVYGNADSIHEKEETLDELDDEISLNGENYCQNCGEERNGFANYCGDCGHEH